MRKLLIAAIIILGVLCITCEDSEYYARIELYNPDGYTVSYSGSFESDLVEKTEVSGETPAPYEIEVNPEGDHVKATFWKTGDDFTNELVIELIYRGVTRQSETVLTPYTDIVILECDIP